MTIQGKFCSLALAALLMAGCGSSGGDGYEAPTPIGTVQNRGIAAFNFVLARAVPSNVDTIEFWGYDANNTLVYGPAPRVKAAQIVLDQLPLYLTRFQIDYYDGDYLVGQGSVPIILSPNGRVSVENPDFVDVTATSLVALPEAFQVNSGTARSLNATVTLSNGDSFSVLKDATYISSNPAVATVDSQGRVSGLTTGTSTITVSYRDLVDTVQVEVVAP